MIEKRPGLAPFKKSLYLPWWASGKFLQQSEFDSHWSFQFFCKISFEKNKNKKRGGVGSLLACFDLSKRYNNNTIDLESFFTLKENSVARYNVQLESAV